MYCLVSKKMTYNIRSTIICGANAPLRKRPMMLGRTSMRITIVTRRSGRVSLAGTSRAPHCWLLVTKAPPLLDAEEIRSRVEKTYNCEVATVIPHSDEVMTLASAGVFVLRYPDNPITAKLKQVTARLMA